MKKNPITFYLYMPFTIEPDSWFLVFLAVSYLIFLQFFNILDHFEVSRVVGFCSGLMRVCKPLMVKSKRRACSICPGSTLCAVWSIAVTQRELQRLLKIISCHRGKAHVWQEDSVSLVLFNGHL